MFTSFFKMPDFILFILDSACMKRPYRTLELLFNFAEVLKGISD